MSSTGTCPKLTRKLVRSPLKNIQQQQVVYNVPDIKKPLLKEAGFKPKTKLIKQNCQQLTIKNTKTLQLDLNRRNNDKENCHLRHYENKSIGCRSTNLGNNEDSHLTKIKIKRSKSESRQQREPRKDKTIEEILNDAIIYDNDKITYTRENYNIDFAETVDTGFTDAKKFFGDDKAGQISVVPLANYNGSPIPNEVTRRSSNFNLYLDQLDVPTPKKRAEKTTLRKRVSSSSSQSIKPFLLDIYCTDYIEDIVTYLQRLEDKHTLKEIDVNAYISIDYRFKITNWIMKITDVMHATDSIVYMSMRLFHYIVINLRMRRNSYMLVAITCFWIVQKLINCTVTMKPAKLFTLCSGKYSKNEFISMEWKILQRTHFNLNIIDHNDFLYYYMWKMDFQNNKLLDIASHFVLDCCVLFKEFMIQSPSVLSASAISVAYQAIGGDVTYITGKMSRWIDIKTLNITSGVIMEHVCFVIKNNINGPIDKYSTLDNMFITNIFKKYFVSLSTK